MAVQRCAAIFCLKFIDVLLTLNVVTKSSFTKLKVVFRNAQLSLQTIARLF